MKYVKKIMAMTLTVVMIMMMSMTSLAAKEISVDTGNGSIELTNGTTGKTYKLFKVFDATYNGTNVAYTITVSDNNSEFITALLGENSPFTLKAIAGSSPVKYDIVRKQGVSDKDLLTWVETQVKNETYLQVGSDIVLEENDGQVIQWKNLAYGYYLITSTLGQGAVTIDSNVPDATVIDKDQTPTLDKNIVDDPENPVKVNEAGMDEDIQFEIRTQAKNYEGDKKIFEYVIYDTLDDGFTLNNDISVKINDSEIAQTDYTIIYRDKNGTEVAEVSEETINQVQEFEIVINWTKDGTKDTEHKYLANSEIVVTYSAKLDPDKASDIKVGSTANKNKADVKYFKGDDSNEPSGDLPDVETETFDTQITIKKVDENNKSLTGAEFKLTTTNGTKVVFTSGTDYEEDEEGTYYKLTDGTYTNEAPNDDAEHNEKYEDITKKYKQVSVYTVMGDQQANSEIKAFVKEDGILTFTGLGTGTYKIEETTVPAGYNKADDIEFAINFNAEEKTFSVNDGTLTGSNNVFEITIENKAGTQLPSTGGAGTTMFYLLGGILAVGAAVLLVTKRRMRSEE